ncbi:zinc-binding dehydrogenase [Arthrobacter mangrovi]|uniref:Oxidoreductase n=1 Tax=Arthrobacter mangrovi TaxID=2966350 RepID=A0ABQ5MYR6_9MICC|nr:zinc-binding dehydrogenase [Arthrobacter mangrovi]GLB68995.1 oxidoreductase [Arthrobacter mangrovi]
MHGIIQRAFGGPDVLRFEERPELQSAPGQARIAVLASGVHLLDAGIRSGTSFGALPKPELPMVPGREVAGRVDAVGGGVDPAWLGRPVVAHLGAASGGYAEQALAAAASLHAVPEGLDAATAVAAIGTGRTAALIVEQVEIRPDDIVLVPSAAGGLGVLLVQAAKAAGAWIAGLAGSDEKVRIARNAGADVVVNYRSPGWAEELERLPRPTLVFDGVGGHVGRVAFELLAEGGRQLVFGWSSGGRNDYSHPAKTTASLLGPVNAERLRALEAEALARAADGSRVPLVGSSFPLASAAEAHRALEARETYGKIVLLTEGDLA